MKNISRKKKSMENLRAVGELKVNSKLWVCDNIILVCTVYLPGNFILSRDRMLLMIKR